MPPVRVVKLYRVILPVADIERAADFYGRVFGAPGERVSPGRHYFDCGGVVLACYDPRADGDEADAAPLPDHLYFASDDLEATFERCLAAGAILPDAEIPDVGRLGEIVVRPWGERSFYAADPWDNPLCFVDAKTVFRGG